VHHAREADDVDSIIEFAPQAARAAMAIESHREALDHFRTLEPYLDRIAEADRAAIVDDWARNEFYRDNVESLDIMARAIELHRSIGADHALARALTFSARLDEVNGRPESADASAVEAVAILESYPASADLAFAVSQRAWLAFMRGNSAGALELADQAIATAEEVGDELTIIYSLNTKGGVTYQRGDPAGLTMLEEARKRAEHGGYSFEETRALINMTAVAAERREVERAADLAQRARDTAARYEIRTLEAYAQAQYAEVLQLKGDWATAEDMASEVLGSHSHTEVMASWVLGTLQARRGRPEARVTLDRSWSLAEANEEIQNLGPAAAANAEYMWLAGEDRPDRIARFRKVLDQGIQLGLPWPSGSLAFWLWKLGRLDTIPIGIAEPHRLVMGGEPAAAADIWEAMGLPYERAAALMHGDEAAQIQSLRIFEELGATATANRVRRTLLDIGVAVPRGRSRSTRDHAAGLTARQAEVLNLLAEGLSNTEMADRLFVSPRTIENHVGAILMKLDVPTRDVAVEAAHDRGILAAT
jgi:DNA-binding CsgD family transcriptional regulator